MKLIEEHFKELSPKQLQQFNRLETLYREWNAKINVISRKDIDALYLKHVLHSLGIAKIQPFHPGSRVLDVGTGGGFPGIPLAIMYPETEFVLVDSIAKKIKVVSEVSDNLGLKNVEAIHIRAEKVRGQFDFIVSRAVTNMNDFVRWVRNRTSKTQKHELENGILYLKGGDLTEELKTFPKAKIFDLAQVFNDAFFITKKVVHLPL